MEALSPLPCTKTMGGNSVMEGPVAQAVVSRTLVSAMKLRRVVVMWFCLLSNEKRPRLRAFAVAGRSGEDARRVLHSFRDFSQVVQGVPVRHIQLRELLEVMAAYVFV